MKYFERLAGDKDEVKESKYGIEVINGRGHRFIISFDNQDRLIIQSPYGNIFVQPQYANSIAITTNER